MRKDILHLRLLIDMDQEFFHILLCAFIGGKSPIHIQILRIRIGKYSAKLGRIEKIYCLVPVVSGKSRKMGQAAHCADARFGLVESPHHLKGKTVLSLIADDKEAAADRLTFLQFLPMETKEDLLAVTGKLSRQAFHSPVGGHHPAAGIHPFRSVDMKRAFIFSVLAQSDLNL